jgi:alkanesulfonate monooxygenase SsuD/methylene tetrahydromethanopterin reductase-like flavin-dependent oxidoreductase (luciferase family)
VIVGGNGERRTLAIAARLGDACNLPSDVDVLRHKLGVLDRHLATAGRTRDDVAVTVLDLPVVGRDREDAWTRVERLRGRTAAAAFARRTHAGTVEQHRERYAGLQALGVSTVFVGVRGLEGADDVLALAGLNA